MNDRRRTWAGLLCSLIASLTIPQGAHAETFGSGANTFNIDFVTIGNPGNVADTTGGPSPAGSVAYVYNMGKYEISRDMITKANNVGNLAITLADMSGYGGNGVNRPATGVTWNEAARFVNWLNTSHGYTPAYKFTTQPGDGGYNANQDASLWGSGDAGYNAANPARNSLAHYFLPSIDEWYKAAYYDPTSGVYYDYPTGSNSAPIAVASGTTPGTAVYGSQGTLQGPADITLAGGLSPYGTMAQGGNVFEWMEGPMYRGGSWGPFFFPPTSPKYMLSTVWGFAIASGEGDDDGFRIASIPEPSTLLLAIASFAILPTVRRKSGCQNRV